jgi:phage shock protein PspC (stress-responsive transcriptional regulator)
MTNQRYHAVAYDFYGSLYHEGACGLQMCVCNYFNPNKSTVKLNFFFLSSPPLAVDWIMYIIWWFVIENILKLQLS